jgi:hypothetical protein
MRVVRIPPLHRRAHASEQPQPLNVLFILVDDMGWRDLVCYGHEIHETSNIDALAEEKAAELNVQLDAVLNAHGAKIPAPGQTKNK